MKKWIRQLPRWLAAALLLAGVQARAADTLPTVQPVMTCEQLSHLSLNEAAGAPVNITSATRLSTAKGTFCQVKATIAPAIKVEVALPPGSELRWPVPADADGHSMSEMMVLPALQSVLLPGGKQPIQSMRDFPLNAANFARVAQLAPLYNAANTNLSRYQQRGGKLMMWHGLADDSVSPAFSLAYYRGVEKQLGEQVTHGFARLFLLPGVGHCGGGDGPDQLDLLTPLMAWTEQGQAPQQIITGTALHPQRGGPAGPPPAGAVPPGAAHGAAGGPASAEAQFHGIQKPSSPLAEPMTALKATRPVYPYPYIARYSGTGSVNEAASYRPVKSDAWDNLQVAEPASDFIGPDNQKNYTVKNGELVAE